MYYSAKNYSKAIQWLQRAQKEGDNSETTRNLITSARFASGDKAGAAAETARQIAAVEKSGRAASEESYQLMANVASGNTDKTEYIAALEKLVTHYPKRDYWADLLNRLPGKKGFNSRLGVDISRLRLALGLLKTKDDYMELAQLVLRQGQGAEAKKIVAAGFAAGMLGTGPDAERHNRLRALADKTAADNIAGVAAAEAEAVKAKDGYALSNIGYNLVQAGQTAKGLEMMERGLKMDGQYAEQIRLHLGMAYAQAGKKQQAIQTLKAVTGNDGAADLARYWVIQIQRPLAA
jgi:lipopolysaccharide biosynthesis regulator YciM